MNFYSNKAKSRRWTMTALAYVLDTCRVNASTVIALNQSIEPRNTNSFDFEITLVLQLVSSRYVQDGACRKAFKIKSKSPLVNPEKILTIRRSYMHFQCSLPSNAGVKFAQLKSPAVRG